MLSSIGANTSRNRSFWSIELDTVSRLKPVSNPEVTHVCSDAVDACAAGGLILLFALSRSKMAATTSRSRLAGSRKSAQRHSVDGCTCLHTVAQAHDEHGFGRLAPEKHVNQLGLIRHGARQGRQRHKQGPEKALPRIDHHVGLECDPPRGVCTAVKPRRGMRGAYRARTARAWSDLRRVRQRRKHAARQTCDGCNGDGRNGGGRQNRQAMLACVAELLSLHRAGLAADVKHGSGLRVVRLLLAR